MSSCSLAFQVSLYTTTKTKKATPVKLLWLLLSWSRFMTATKAKTLTAQTHTLLTRQLQN